MSGGFTNRLISEKSPYLLQHAHNPVDWYPWGNEAFAASKTLDRPIFLSIGYSTCYWCHVMEREVFENESIAAAMNNSFVCIKVDREERPDIDRIYMTAVQLMTGSGGWPMSLFLTPDLRPFFAGTYFPPDSRYGRPGFSNIITKISEMWHSDREALLRPAGHVSELLQSLSAATPGRLREHEPASAGFEAFRKQFDEVNGGFGHGAKFPRPAVIDFLLRYHDSTGSADALSMAVRTLEALVRGGVHDQIGSGFHRYAVDREWRIPHFEKMLYDQAQIASTLLDAFLLTGSRSMAAAAVRTLEFVGETLTDPSGGFWSAEDAESAVSASRPDLKSEGAFYLWTKDEIAGILGSGQAEIFCDAYGIAGNGNVVSDPHGVFSGKNIPWRAHTAEETAAALNVSASQVESSLDNSLALLRQARARRPRPFLDDKIITAWNGLMISAFSRGYQVIGDRHYLLRAEAAAAFILEKCVDPDSKMLFRRYRDGDARFPAGLQDYAFLIRGLCDLYEASFSFRWLKAAIDLMERQIGLFYDRDNGGFFETTADDPSVIVRLKEDYDGAEPSGNSVSALNLIKLSILTANTGWRSMAERTITSFASRLEQNPDAVPLMLVALEELLADPLEIVIAGNRDADDTNRLLRVVRSRYRAGTVVLLADDSGERNELEAMLPVIRGMKTVDGKAAAYVCRNFACQMPVTEQEGLRRLLSNE